MFTKACGHTRARSAHQCFSMASLNSSQRQFGSTASNLRKLKSILNASLVGSNESVILTNQTVSYILKHSNVFAV
jgi:hypothetical protein